MFIPIHAIGTALNTHKTEHSKALAFGKLSRMYRKHPQDRIKVDNIVAEMKRK